MIFINGLLKIILLKKKWSLLEESRSSSLVEWQRLVLGVAITTTSWILTTLLTKPTDHKTLMQFYRKVTPGGIGWKKVIERTAQNGENVQTFKKQNWDVPTGLIGVLLGLIIIYSILFSAGFWLYSNRIPAVLTLVTALMSTFFLMKLWNRFKVL